MADTSDADRVAQLAGQFAVRYAEADRFRRLLEPLRVGGLEPVEGEIALLADLETRLESASDLFRTLAPDQTRPAQLARLAALLDDVNWELAEELRDDLGEKRTRQVDLLRQTNIDLRAWESRLAAVAKVVDSARLDGAPFSELEADLRAARSSVARISSALTDRLHGALASQKVAAEQAIASLETKLAEREPQVSKVKKLVKQADLLIMQVAGKRGKLEYRVLLRSADRFQTRGINIIQDVRSVSTRDRAWMAEQLTRLSSGANEARRLAHPSTIVARSATASPATTPRPAASAEPVTTAEPAAPAGPATANGPARTIRPAAPSAESSLEPVEVLGRLGEFMLRLVIPEQIQTYLRKESWSFTITTNDLALPWELIAFDGHTAEGETGRRHLCLERSISRMPLGGAFPQTVPQRRVVGTERRRRMLLIYSDPHGTLPAAKQEVDLVQQALSSQNVEVERVDPENATNANLNEILMGQSFDFIHYAGHAYFDARDPGQSGLMLKDDVLTADKIRVLSRGGSLVFLNACESGTVARDTEPQQASYLLRTPEPVVGLASAFVYSGALSCVGSLWPVYDRPAAELAVEFYKNVLSDEPTGEALRQARTHIRDKFPRDIAWAGYVLYGDPTFRLTET